MVMTWFGQDEHSEQARNMKQEYKSFDFQSGQDIITENAHFSPWESVNISYLKCIIEIVFFLHMMKKIIDDFYNYTTWY